MLIWWEKHRYHTQHTKALLDTSKTGSESRENYVYVDVTLSEGRTKAQHKDSE
jgi:hypothetical protein